MTTITQQLHHLLTLDEPAPPARARPKKEKLTAAQVTKLNDQLWEGLAQGDLEVVQNALDEGASPTKRRDGAAPIYRAVSEGKWDIAELLRSEGGDVQCTTQQGQTLWAGISSRDLPEEAERLVRWGLESTAAGESFGGPRLSLWWAKRHPKEARAEWGKNHYATAHRCVQAIGGDAEYRNILNEILKIDPSEPLALGKKNQWMAQILWDHILRQDQVELARTAIACGWGPPIVEKPGKNGYSPWDRTTEWTFVELGSKKILAWWLQVPEFKRRMQEVAMREPDQSWVKVVLDGGVDKLDRIANLGVVDVAAYTDKDGNTLAHLIFRDKPTKAMADWWIRHHPEVLQQTNNAGRIAVPTDAKNAKLSAYVQNQLMKRLVTKAPKKAKDVSAAPARRRM